MSTTAGVSVYNGSTSVTQAVINGNVVANSNILNYGKINLDNTTNETIVAGSSSHIANISNYGEINANYATANATIQAYETILCGCQPTITQGRCGKNCANSHD